MPIDRKKLKQRVDAFFERRERERKAEEKRIRLLQQHHAAERTREAIELDRLGARIAAGIRRDLGLDQPSAD